MTVTTADIMQIANPYIRDAARHSLKTSSAPDMDKAMCEALGKSIRISVKLDPYSSDAAKQSKVELRGQIGSANFWNNSIARDEAQSSDTKHVFFVHVSPENINTDFSFKLVINGNLWETISNEGNRLVSLKDYGSVVHIKVRDALFT